MLIVRNTIPEDEVEDLVGDLLKYMYNNNALPSSKNQVWHWHNTVHIRT